MEELHASSVSMAMPLNGNLSEMDRGDDADVQSSSPRMKADDLAQKLGEPRWDMEYFSL
jgi:hypothetical protein